MNIIKYINLFFSLIFFLITSVEVNSQCGISSLNLSNIQCVENASYEFDINFIVTEGGLDSFNVYINDNLEGQYSQDDLPVHIINNYFSGKNSDVVRVEDKFNNECYDEEEVGNPCGCAQFDFTYTKLHCTDSTFNILFDLKFFNTSDSFDIGMINSPFGAHAYKDLPIEIGPFYIADTTYYPFMADKTNIFCFLETPIPGDSCPQCGIHNIDLLSYECDEDFNKYMKFVFEYNNPSSTQYNIFIDNNFYQSNNYLFQNIADSVNIQDTFVIGPIDISCDSILNVKIEDSMSPGCNSVFNFDSICCKSCEIGNIDIRDKQYGEDSKLNFILDFDYFRNRTDSFELNSTNGFSNKFSIEDLPINITDYFLGENDFDTLTICMDNGICCNSTILEYPACEINELKIRDIECSSDSTFDFFLNFNYVRNRLDSFTLKSSDGISSKYSLEELPIRIQNYPINDWGFDTLTVCLDNEKCCTSGIIEFPDCDYFDCNISDVNYEITFDTIESYWITLDFNVKNTSDSFLIKGNGRNYGHFSYNDVPVKLGPYNCNDSIVLEYVIRDLEIESCKIVVEPGRIICPPNDILPIVTASEYAITYFMDNKILRIVSKNKFSKNSHLSIFNIFGQKLKEYKLPLGGKTVEFGMEKFLPGIYFIKLTNGIMIKGKKIFID